MITAKSLGSGTGIGGSDSGNISNVTIGGGTVTANGSNGSAGIGGGCKHGDESDNCVINITGGTVTAKGMWGGAGIGNGEDSNGQYTVNISGGNVTATASNYGIFSTSKQYSEAIGSGYLAHPVTVNITGGTINASTADDTGQSKVFRLGTFDYPDCMVIATSPNNQEIIPAAEGRRSALEKASNIYNKFVIMPCDHRNADAHATTQDEETYHHGSCPSCGTVWDGHDEASKHVWAYEAESTTHTRTCKICKYTETGIQHSGNEGDLVCECGHGLVMISFDSGGGEGQMNAVIAADDISYTLPECSFTSPDSRAFVGWRIGNTTEIKAKGASIDITKDTTLTAVWSGSWKDLKERMAAGGDITLDTDYIADNSGNSEEDGTLIVPEGKTVNLNLNGHVINRNRANSGEDGGVITVKGTLNITDSSVDKAGEIRGGKNYHDAGGVTVDGGTLTLEGGSIVDNLGTTKLGDDPGTGGVIIMNNGKFIMTGGYITGNTGDIAGGVEVTSGEFTMSGGSIYSNMGILTGGVQIISGSFDMIGGYIVENKGMVETGGSLLKDLHGSGGVTIEGSNAVFTMSGGAISRNGQGSGKGNGVRFIDGTFNVKDKAVIIGNHKYDLSGSEDSTPDEDSNVYLDEDKTINVTCTLQPNALIGVTTAVAPVTGSPVIITDGFTSDSTQLGAVGCFVSDNTDYLTGLSTEGEIILSADKSVVSFDANGGSGEMASVNVATGTKYYMPACTIAPPTEPENMVFDKWQMGDDTSATYSTGEYVIINDNTTLKATWQSDPSLHTITVVAGEGGTAQASRTTARAEDTVNLVALPAEGFMFDKWTLSDGSQATLGDANKATTTLSNVTTNVTVTASFKEIPVAHAENLLISEDSKTVKEGYETTIYVTVEPANAVNKRIIFSSADTSVAEVDETGKITGIKEGQTVITCEAEDQTNSPNAVQCTVTVTHEHDLTKMEEKQASCTEDGNIEYYVCNKGDYACGKFFADAEGTEEVEEADIVAHAPGHASVEHPAVEETCTTAGNDAYWKCDRCGKYFSDAGCTTEIAENSWVIPADPSKHAWSFKGFTWDENEHTAVADYECSNNAIHKDMVEAIVTYTKTESTCTAKGNDTYKATVSASNSLDGEAHKDNKVYDRDLLAHALTETEAKEATCTEAGNSAYWTCSVCHKYFSDEDGNEEVAENSWVKPALGHDFGDWENVDDENHKRTCGHEGCGAIETEAHNWNAGVVITQPTCSTEGEKTFTCSGCGATKTEKIDIDPDAHAWNEGEITTPATETSNGVKTFTCSVCGKTKTESIPKLTPGDSGNIPTPAPGSDPNQKGKDGTAVGPGASAACADKAITSMKSDNDPAGSKFSALKLKSTKQGKNSVKLTWTKAKGAASYVVYGNACGTKNRMKKLKTVKTNSYNVKKISKKLKKGKYHKFIVVALDKNNNVVSTSTIVHVATTGGKVGNNKSVTVTKKVVNKAKKLKKGKTLKLKAKAVAKSKKLKVKKHVAVRYESTNTKIATVSKAGVVKAKAKGTCYIYAYAQNGVYKKIKVKVS